jgi:hypothetical protein
MVEFEGNDGNMDVFRRMHLQPVGLASLLSLGGVREAAVKNN